MVTTRIWNSYLSVILLLVCEAASEIVCQYALKLESVEVDENGIATNENISYPPGTYWKNDDGYFGCPCLFRPCIRLCSTEWTEEFKNYIVLDGNFEVEVVTDDGDKKTVALNEHFVVWKESLCHPAFVIDPAEEKYLFLSNGSLKLSHFEGELESILLFSEYCLMKDNASEPVVLECLNEEVEKQTKGQGTLLKSRVVYILYNVFMAISIVFIILTILAYIFTPEMKSLHGKCIIFQSGTLAVAYVGFIIIHQTGSFSHIAVCKISAYTVYVFLMSSFCWINCMCFDLFWITKYDNSSANKRLKCYIAYSTLFPTVLLISVLILDFSLNGAWTIWPGIGIVKCWFNSRWAEFFLFHGPILVMLKANLVLCVIAFVQDKRTKQYKLKSDADAGSSNQTDNIQTALLYVKLFILMGGTWLMEFISWVVGGPQEYWIFTDLINCSRGLLIFIVCVACNARVRGSLLYRVMRKNYQTGGINQAPPIGNFTAAIEFINLKNEDEAQSPR